MNRARDGKPYTFPLILAVDPHERKRDAVCVTAPRPGGDRYIHPMPLPWTADFARGFAQDRTFKKSERVLIAIEKPRNWKRFKQAATQANRVRDEMRKLWPRHTVIVFVDVNDWRSDIGLTIPKGGTPEQRRATWKQAAVEMCRQMSGTEPNNDDEAEAYLIARWLIHQERAYRAGRPNDIDGSRR